MNFTLQPHAGGNPADDSTSPRGGDQVKPGPPPAGVQTPIRGERRRGRARRGGKGEFFVADPSVNAAFA
jgi:hypothetical protein